MCWVYRATLGVSGHLGCIGPPWVYQATLGVSGHHHHTAAPVLPFLTTKWLRKPHFTHVSIQITWRQFSAGGSTRCTAHGDNAYVQPKSSKMKIDNEERQNNMSGNASMSIHVYVGVTISEHTKFFRRGDDANGFVRHLSLPECSTALHWPIAAPVSVFRIPATGWQCGCATSALRC